MKSLEMYQETLLAHNEQPHHFYALSHPSHQAQGKNPLCGDEITVYMQIENDILRTISFTGQGCAICKASASLMTARLEGKTIVQAKEEAERILAWLTDAFFPCPKDLGELEALQGVRNFPMRLKCATLAWHTFQKACDTPVSSVCACQKNSSHSCGCSKHVHPNGSGSSHSGKGCCRS